MDLSASATRRRGLAHAAARGSLRRRDRGGRARAGREAAAHARAGRRGGRQPPDRRARVPQARRARLRDRQRRPRHLRAHRWLRRGAPSTATTGRSTRCRSGRSRYSEQMLADAFATAGRERPDLAGHGLAVAQLYPTAELARITADGVRGGGRRGAVLPPRRGTLRRCASSSPRAAARPAGPRTPDEIVVTSGAKQALSLAARATLEEGDVAVIESPTFIGMLELAAPYGRARDRRARGRGRARRGRAGAAARPPRGEAGGAPDRLPEPHRARPLGGSPAAARRAGRGAQLLRARGPGLRRRCASRASPSARCASSRQPT